MERLCRLFGVSRQALYYYFKQEFSSKQEERFVLHLVKQIRLKHPKIGARKLHYLLEDQLKNAQIKMGRDKLFTVLRKHQLLVRKTRKYIHTTNSKHWFKKHPNLIKEIEINRPDKVWVSDITYLQKEGGFMYLSLVTDAYSRKIVGYHIGDSLAAVHTIKALEMALQTKEYFNEELIHHSDRGMQYCCHEYVKLLQDYNIKISMTQNGDPLENAIAERVNGILKQEYFDYKTVYNQQKLKEAIDLYNKERPHMSCNMLTPEQAHKRMGKLRKSWKNYYKSSTLVNQ